MSNKTIWLFRLLSPSISVFCLFTTALSFIAGNFWTGVLGLVAVMLNAAISLVFWFARKTT